MDNIQWHIDSIERSLAEIKRMSLQAGEVSIDFNNTLTPTVFAKRCGCSRTMIINMIKGGEIRYTQTSGGHYRIPSCEVDRVAKT